MITCFDYLSQFRKDTETQSLSLRNFLSSTSELIPWMDILSMDGGFETSTEIFDFDSSEEATDVYSASMVAFVRTLLDHDGLSSIPRNFETTREIIGQDGKVLIMKIYGEYSSLNKQIVHLYIDLIIDEQPLDWYSFSIELVPNEDKAYYSVERGLILIDPAVEWINDVSFVQAIALASESITISDLIIDSCSMALKGTLNATNLRTRYVDSINRFSDKAKFALNTICDATDGLSGIAQLTALSEAFNSLTTAVNTAVADEVGSRISFTSDQLMDDSILIPVSALVQTVSSLLTVIVSVVAKPVIGLVVGTLGAGISSIISTITENERDVPLITSLNDAGNFCFSNAVQQQTCTTNTWPSDMRDIINDLYANGFIKITCGWMTTYMWVTGRTTFNMESFLNMNCDFRLRMSEQILHYLDYDTNMSCVVTQSGFHKIYNARLIGKLPSLKDSFKLLFTRSGNIKSIGSGGLLNTDNDTTALVDASERLMLNLFYTSWYILNDYYVNYPDNQPFCADKAHDYWFDDPVTISGPADAIQILMCFLNWFYYGSTGVKAPDAITGLRTNLNANRGYLDNQLWYGIVTNVIPAMRYLIANYGSNCRMFMLSRGNNNNIVNDGYNDISNEPDYILQGDGCDYVIAYDSLNHENPYLCPPKSKFNIWVRVAFTVAAVAAIVITTVVIKAKIRKKLAYKAAIARSELQRKVAAFNDPDNALYQNKDLFYDIYKGNKRYNFFWGALTGTTYDAMNDWIDYPSSMITSGSVLSTLSNELLSDSGIVKTSLNSINQSMSGVTDDVSTIAGAASNINASAGVINTAANNIQRSTTDLEHLIDDEDGNINKILTNTNDIKKYIK